MNGEDLGVMKRGVIKYRQESSVGLWRETELVCGCKLMAFRLAGTSRVWGMNYSPLGPTPP